MSRALLMSGTGAIGSYMAQRLLSRGWEVTVTSRHPRRSSEGLRFIQGNARTRGFAAGLMSDTWDLVVDFTIRGTDDFRALRDSLLGSSGRYMYVSSYRTFAEADVIVEDSPQLLDVSTDRHYLSTDEYALSKARQERLLREGAEGNWVIVRPAITYSCGRHQLCTLEAETWLRRALTGKKVVLPEAMLEKLTTMTWAGDVAEMMVRLAELPDASGQDFNVATSQHLTWRSVLETYLEIVPFEVCLVSLSEYERTVGGVAQIRYDRMFDRVLDNAKVLEATGINQGDLMPVKEGFRLELGRFLSDPHFKGMNPRTEGRLDRLSGDMESPLSFRGHPKDALVYAKNRLLR